MKTKNKYPNGWRQKSIEILEKEKWVEPDEYPTGLIERCFKLRKIPVDKLGIEDLRTLIGQQIGLEFLIPIAIEMLTSDILSEGDLYRGDLLQSVLRVDVSFWKQNLDYQQQISELIKNRRDEIEAEGIDRKQFDGLN